MTMRKVIAASCFVGLAFATTGVRAAALVSPTTGQPGAPTNTCGSANPVMPGNAANVAGSPFNPNGQAGAVYAGNPGTASLNQSNSSVAMSHYDAACVRLSH